MAYITMRTKSVFEVT